MLVCVKENAISKHQLVVMHNLRCIQIISSPVYVDHDVFKEIRIKNLLYMYSVKDISASLYMLDVAEI